MSASQVLNAPTYQTT